MPTGIVPGSECIRCPAFCLTRRDAMSNEALMSLVLQSVLQVVVPAAASMVVGLLGAYLWKLIQKARLALNQSQLEVLDMLARQFVLAAEQYDLGGVAQRVGAEKKNWVIGRLEAALAVYGIRIDLDLIADVVEAAVHTELTQVKAQIDIEYDDEQPAAGGVVTYGPTSN